MNQDGTKTYQDFIRFIAMAVANMSLYSRHHPQVIRLGQQATEKLKKVMGEKRSLSFLRIDDDLVVDNAPLLKSIYLSRLVRVLHHHGIEHITFTAEVNSDELLSFLASLLNREKQKLSTSRNITLGHVELKNPKSFNDLDAANECLKKLRLSDVPNAEILKFAEIYEEIRKKRKLHVKGIGEIVACFIDALRNESDSFLALASIRMMDEYTFTHSTNVCVLNLAQALALGIEGPLLHDIGVAAMLHDVGKLFIPEEVLSKPGKLTEEEWDLIQQHPVKGAQYLLDTPGLAPLATITAFEHHRKNNGRGYPHVEGNPALNLCSQMTAISDIFDALRTKRSYRDSLEIETVIKKIADLAGTELHPGLTKNFLNLLAPFVSSNEEEADRQEPAPENAWIVSGQA